jgi:exportin-1
MDSIIWAIKHTMRDIADTGLNRAFILPSYRLNALTSFEVCSEVVNNFAGAADPAVSTAFFQQYFLSIVQDVFFVLTDTDHKSGFKLQSALLAHMFQLVELNMIHAPLFDPSQPAPSNAVFLREYCANLLKTAFPHVQPYVAVYRYVDCILTDYLPLVHTWKHL